MTYYGAIEGGGTKMVLAIGTADGQIIEQTSIPTVSPEVTLPLIIDWFENRGEDKKVVSIGIACFGPIDMKPGSATYGYITTTPKHVWANCDICGIISRALQVPVGFDTDVNGSLLGEVTYGSARGIGDAVYITIGTGIGMGIMSHGNLIHGMLHPEAGHLPVIVRSDDKFEGNCMYHKTCLEGMASGPAIEKRWGKKAIELRDIDEVWDLEAYYIAQAIVSLIYTVSPRRIILGGGVMHQVQLFPMIRSYVSSMLAGYLNTPELSDLDSYIVPASLDDAQGILGCIKLAVDVADKA